MFLANKLNKGAGVPTPVDAQFNYVTMLLHGDGTNGAQNNTFLDSSTNNFTITRNGNTTQGSFSPYGDNWSNNFPAGSSYLNTPSSSQFTFGTGDFTIEFWINTSITDFNIMNPSSATGSGYWGLLFQSGNLRWNDAYNTTNLFAISATAILNGAWHHVAICRSSGSTKVYYDGVSQTTQTDTTNYSGVADWRIGLGNVSGGGFNGYLSNFRVNKGTAVYTSNFTPSTTNLTAISGTSLLTCQNNRFIDNSPNGFALTTGGTPSVQRFNPFGTSTAYSTSVIGGSGYFDGSGDYLTVADNAVFNLGSSDFTLEGWVYRISASSQSKLVVQYSGGADQRSWGVFLESSGAITLITDDDGLLPTTQIATSSGVIPLNAWTHIRVSRVGTTGYIGVNGTIVTTGSVVSTIYNATVAVEVGTSFDGYMTDVRVVNGTALSTSSYTVPTAPLTAITNTALLCNFQNGAIFDNAMMNDLETVGNAQISTSVVKYGTGSLAFDGTGDYLSTRSTPNLAFGSGDFTIEAWVYATSLGSYNAVFAQWPDNGGSANNSYTLETVGSNMEFYWASSAGLHGPATLGTITTGVWIHYAICRSGNTLYPFKNGVLGTTTSITQTLNSPTSAVTIGGAVAGGGDWIGYIDDLRITKGYARYTANFSVPTAAFPNTGPV